MSACQVGTADWQTRSVHRYTEVDVFCGSPLGGNPVAVVHDADDLSDQQMADFARWTNLSETVFLLAPRHPNAHYRVRIFTPTTELPFAGHPTLGACRAWLHDRGSSVRGAEFIQECELGAIVVRSASGTRLSFVAPPLVRSGPVEEALLERVVHEIGIQRQDVVAAAWIDNGPGWLGLQLASATQVLSLKVHSVSTPLGVVGLCGEEADAAYEVRAFFPEADATIEDPVTGSLNASLAQWLVSAGVVTPPYVARQGSSRGRDGRIFIEADGEDLLVGGETQVVVSGSVVIGSQ